MVQPRYGTIEANLLRAGRALSVLVLSCWALAASGETVDFTRLLHQPQQPVTGATELVFSSQAGSARLLLTWPDEMAPPTIRLNGQAITYTAANSELQVTLQASNTLSITHPSGVLPAHELRVKQTAEVNLHVLARVHFNTNVSDFARSRDFYGALGFETLSGFPDTNTQAMARAIGIETPTLYDGSRGGEAGGYLLHGELIGLGFMLGAIDLIEFSIPKDDAPPYGALNHLGMARAVLLTTDLSADYSHLVKTGCAVLERTCCSSRWCSVCCIYRSGWHVL